MQRQMQMQRQIRGSLHCAAHDETVSSFGRDDDLFMVANDYLWSLRATGLVAMRCLLPTDGRPWRSRYISHEVTAARAGRSLIGFVLIFFVVIEGEIGFFVVLVVDLYRGSGL